MGMSTHAVGFKPPDEKWLKMKAIWDACRAGGVEVPADVGAFFGWNDPSAAGVAVDQKTLVACGAVAFLSDGERSERDCGGGMEIDIRKLPPDVTIVRIVNSW